MSNYVMSVDFFGNAVRAETEGCMISLTDLTYAGNVWRMTNGRKAYQLAAFISSDTLREYIAAASTVWGIPIDAFIKSEGRGNTKRTMGHLSVAVLLAEQISPFFHAMVHKTFLEGKLLEFREQGGTEFKSLNAAIDLYLPGRENKPNNKNVYIQCAIQLRTKLLGKDAKAEAWDSATVAQTHSRYAAEKSLVQFLQLGMVRDYEHLKELIQRV
jgi:hypothetical protein